MPPNPPEKLPGAGMRLRQQSADRISIEVDRTVGAAENQRRFDEPRRKQTLTSFPDVRIPIAPASPLEYRPTVPARALTAPTVPAQAEPTGIRIPADDKLSLAPPSATPDAAALAASRADGERLRLKVAELEWDARAAAEVKQASFPPPVKPSPVPVPTVVASKEPETEAVIGWLVKRAVANRAAIYALVAALGVGGGGVAIKQATDKPKPEPVTMAQLEQALDKQRTRKGGSDDQTRALNDLLDLAKCQRRKITQIGKSMLPAPDHVGTASKVQPFDDDCPDPPRRLPDP